MSRYELRYLRRDGKTQTKPVNFKSPYEAQKYLDASRENLIQELGYDPKVELLRLEDDNGFTVGRRNNPFPAGSGIKS